MQHLLPQVFGVGSSHSISILQECARALIVFAYGLLLVRVAGRRVFGKWSALDIIVSIIVGSALARTLTGNAPLWGTFAATALIMVLHWVLAQAAALWPTAARVLEGRPITLTERGRLDETARKRHAVSEADLNEALRQRGLSKPDQAKRITLEPSGRITIVKEQ